MVKKVRHIGAALVAFVFCVLMFILYLIRAHRKNSHIGRKEPETERAPRVFIVARNMRQNMESMQSDLNAPSAAARDTPRFNSPPPEYTTVEIPELHKPPEYTAPPSYNEAMRLQPTVSAT